MLINRQISLLSEPANKAKQREFINLGLSDLRQIHFANSDILDLNESVPGGRQLCSAEQVPAIKCILAVLPGARVVVFAYTDSSVWWL